MQWELLIIGELFIDERSVDFVFENKQTTHQYKTPISKVTYRCSIKYSFRRYQRRRRRRYRYEILNLLGNLRDYSYERVEKLPPRIFVRSILAI